MVAHAHAPGIIGNDREKVGTGFGTLIRPHWLEQTGEEQRGTDDLQECARGAKSVTGARAEVRNAYEEHEDAEGDCRREKPFATGEIDCADESHGHAQSGGVGTKSVNATIARSGRGFRNTSGPAR